MSDLSRNFALCAATAVLLVVGLFVSLKVTQPLRPGTNAVATGNLDVSQESPDALLVQYRQTNFALPDTSLPEGWMSSATALAPGSLRAMPGNEPVDFGPFGFTYPSPDSRLLAIWHAAAIGEGRVEVFDVEHWHSLRRFDVPAGLLPFAWSTDDSALYASRDYCAIPKNEGGCVVAWQREVWSIDVSTGATKLLAELDFQPSTWRLDGPSRAVTLGLDTDTCCGIGAKGPPFVAVLDLTSGQTIARIELPDLMFGQPGNWNGDARLYASYWPATVVSPDGSKLYVFDSVDQRVTTVDLVGLRVASTVDLHEPRSFFTKALDGVKSLFVSTAEAKGGPAYYRQAATTPDGRYLVSSGIVTLTDDNPGNPDRYRLRPAGLLVIDTRTMSVVYKEDTASAFRMSPDGRWILATGSYTDEDHPDGHGSYPTVGFGLRIVDLTKLQETAHLWPDAYGVGLDAMSPDGRFAYVSTNGAGVRADFGCTTDCTRLNLIDLMSGTVVANSVLHLASSIVPVTPLVPR